MDKMDQKVLCIEAKKLFQKKKWNGLLDTDLEYYYELLKNESEFRVRKTLETDINYKQVIPQVILEHKGKYFLHRQVNANEKRLNSLCPLPLGGHVEEFDLSQDGDLIQTALMRELHEEADVKANIIQKSFVGLIYLEDENPVNHVHVGLIYVFSLDGENVLMNEDGLETVGWVDKNYLTDNIDELTYWSRIFVKECLK